MKAKPTKSIELFGGGTIKTNTPLCAADFDAIEAAIYDITGGIGLAGGVETVKFAFVVRAQKDKPATIEIRDVIKQRYNRDRNEFHRNGNIDVAVGGALAGYIDNIVRAGGGTASFHFYGDTKGCLVMTGEVIAKEVE